MKKASQLHLRLRVNNLTGFKYDKVLIDRLQQGICKARSAVKKTTFEKIEDKEFQQWARGQSHK